MDGNQVETGINDWKERAVGLFAFFFSAWRVGINGRQCHANRSYRVYWQDET